jgi:hypothetical protein
MKTIIKLMALFLLLGTLGFAQNTGGDKKDDKAPTSDTDKGKSKKHKKHKAKGSKGATDDKKPASDDKGGDKK